MQFSRPPPTVPTWYLGFDCATKTFAFSLSRVLMDPGAIAALRARAQAAAALLDRVGALLAAGTASGRLVEGAAAAVASLDADTRALVRLADGETADLAPGVPDADLGTVARVKLLAAYVERRVRPALALVPAGEPLKVIVEFQMGHNAAARAIAAALIALFAAHEVAIVGPSLKNRVAVDAAGHLSHFTAKYASNYTANKAQAKHNFAAVEALFGSAIPPCPAALRGHIADSFMQVLGYLVHATADDAF